MTEFKTQRHVLLNQNTTLLAEIAELTHGNKDFERQLTRARTQLEDLSVRYSQLEAAMAAGGAGIEALLQPEVQGYYLYWDK